jgi:gamma-glutamylcyclotransferase (GGCT)/AIG2-like uncharacterized protein YtfP
MNFYFAYGSNMDQKQMLERCPSAKLLGVAVLKGYSLAFTIYSPKRSCGCADIIKSSAADGVYGLLYELTDSDLQSMDAFEGHPVHYQRIAVSVIHNDKEIVAYTYEVVTKEKDLIPSKEYLKIMLDAAVKYSFPESYQKNLELFAS